MDIVTEDIWFCNLEKVFDHTGKKNLVLNGLKCSRIGRKSKGLESKLFPFTDSDAEAFCLSSFLSHSLRCQSFLHISIWISLTGLMPRFSLTGSILLRLGTHAFLLLIIQYNEKKWVNWTERDLSKQQEKTFDSRRRRTVDEHNGAAKWNRYY